MQRKARIVDLQHRQTRAPACTVRGRLSAALAIVSLLAVMIPSGTTAEDGSVDVYVLSTYCTSWIDRAEAVADLVVDSSSRRWCGLAASDVSFSPPPAFYDEGLGDVTARVADGPVTITAAVYTPLFGPPRTFCSRWNAAGDALYTLREVSSVAASASGSDITTHTINLTTEPGDAIDCTFVFRGEGRDSPPTPTPMPTATLPTVNVDPEDLEPRPDLPVTPVVVLPSPTPLMPQLEVTPPIQDPNLPFTPVVVLPTQTPSIPHIQVTPPLQYPIPILTPIVIEPIGGVPATST
jgi:hypothetical protein